MAMDILKHISLIFGETEVFEGGKEIVCSFSF